MLQIFISKCCFLPLIEIFLLLQKQYVLFKYINILIYGFLLYIIHGKAFLI